MIMSGGIVTDAPECAAVWSSEIDTDYLNCADNPQMLLFLTEDSCENVSESLSKAPGFLEVSSDLGRWGYGVAAQWNRP